MSQVMIVVGDKMVPATLDHIYWIGEADAKPTDRYKHLSLVVFVRTKLGLVSMGFFRAGQWYSTDGSQFTDQVTHWALPSMGVQS